MLLAFRKKIQSFGIRTKVLLLAFFLFGFFALLDDVFIALNIAFLCGFGLFLVLIIPRGLHGELVLSVIIIILTVGQLMPYMLQTQGRAKLAEAFTLFSGAKSEAVVYYAQHGHWPAGETAATLVPEHSYANVKHLAWEKQGLVAQMKDSGLGILQLRPRPLAGSGQSVRWDCSPPPVPAGYVPAVYLPAVCRD